MQHHINLNDESNYLSHEISGKHLATCHIEDSRVFSFWYENIKCPVRQGPDTGNWLSVNEFTAGDNLLRVEPEQRLSLRQFEPPFGGTYRLMAHRGIVFDHRLIMIVDADGYNALVAYDTKANHFLACTHRASKGSLTFEPAEQLVKIGLTQAALNLFTDRGYLKCAYETAASHFGDDWVKNSDLNEISIEPDSYEDALIKEGRLILRGAEHRSDCLVQDGMTLISIDGTHSFSIEGWSNMLSKTKFAGEQAVLDTSSAAYSPTDDAPERVILPLRFNRNKHLLVVASVNN